VHNAFSGTRNALIEESGLADAGRSHYQPGLAQLQGRRQGFHFIPPSGHGNE